MDIDKREYINAIKFITYEYILSKGYYIDKNNFGNINLLRKDIDLFFTQNKDKIPDNINEKMDIILQYELGDKKIIYHYNLPSIKHNISVIEYDITNVYADVIVNAANSDGLGCFIPEHHCIDNMIHKKGGPRIREDCKTILKDNKINVGELIVTMGYNLPTPIVFHVVGPIYKGTNKCRLDLIKCYLNSLETLKKIRRRSICFCSISTGIYGFPKEIASNIAINSVLRWMNENKDYKIHVIFCVYTPEEYKTYLSKLQNVI